MIDWQLFLYLVGGSALAIAVLGLFMHLLGRSRRLTVNTAEEAASLFSQDFPDLAATDAALSKKGDMALLSFHADASIGVLRAMGTHWMTRLIGPGDIAKARQTRKGVLKITLHDFADPSISVALAEGGDSAHWLGLLKGLMTKPGDLPAQGSA